jgi:diguanylate cyclase (GGDEF)-like protein/PAS domain S-box-containing protein
MWKRFVTNDFKLSTHEAQFRRAYIINTVILLSAITLFFFTAYNFTVTKHYSLASIEFVVFLSFIALLYYFHKTSNIRNTSYGILLLLFIILAAFIDIIQNREYALYWLTIFPPVAIFLLGRKAGLITSVLFFSYFVVFILFRDGLWKPAVFHATSIVNVVFASAFLVSLIAYFDLSLEEVRNALVHQTEALKEEHAMLDRYVIVCTFDLAGTMTYASKALYDISGYSKEELIGKNHRIVNYFEMDPVLFQTMWSTISKGGAWKGEIKSRKKDGTYYWTHTTIETILDINGKHTSYRAISEDITDRKRVEELAIYDYLTKLYNRSKLDEELSNEILRAARYKTPLCVILLDIDHFKNVNDSYGHQMGDSVLKQIAQLLKKNTRKVDILGRWGGEEFLIVIPSTSIEGGVQLAEKLRAGIESHAFDSIGTQTASFGVTEYHDGDTLEGLIRHVDEALYRAKTNGRNRVET